MRSRATWTAALALAAFGCNRTPELPPSTHRGADDTLRADVQMQLITDPLPAAPNDSSAIVDPHASGDPLHRLLTIAPDASTVHLGPPSGSAGP